MVLSSGNMTGQSNNSKPSDFKKKIFWHVRRINTGMIYFKNPTYLSAIVSCWNFTVHKISTAHLKKTFYQNETIETIIWRYSYKKPQQITKRYQLERVWIENQNSKENTKKEKEKSNPMLK